MAMSGMFEAGPVLTSLAVTFLPVRAERCTSSVLEVVSVGILWWLSAFRPGPGGPLPFGPGPFRDWVWLWHKRRCRYQHAAVAVGGFRHACHDRVVTKRSGKRPGFARDQKSRVEELFGPPLVLVEHKEP